MATIFDTNASAARLNASLAKVVQVPLALLVEVSTASNFMGAAFASLDTSKILGPAFASLDTSKILGAAFAGWSALDGCKNLRGWRGKKSRCTQM